MRSIVCLALSIMFVACATTTASGDGVVRRPLHGRRAVAVATGDIAVGASLENGVLVQGADGNAYLGVWIAVPELRDGSDRPPMAMSLVIDRSGSMAGDKIVNARLAAQSFVSRMRDGDILSIFAYDDEVMQVFGPSVLEPASREVATSRIAELQPGGSTNIYGGLVASQSALASAPASHPLRRAILVSDGLANVGPSSPEELGVIGARGTDLGIQVTTIGVGLDYDERLMLTVAMRGAGRFYHLAEPAQMASILAQELDFMNRTVASGAVLEVIPEPWIEILGAEGIEVRREGRRVMLPLGSLYSTQRREVLLRVRADTAAQGERALGQVRLRFADPDGANERAREVQVAYRVSRSADEARRSRDDRVAAMVQGYRAIAAQRQAAQMLNRGDSAGAATALMQQAQSIRAAAAPLAAPARAEVERRARRLEEQSQRAGRASRPAAARGAALDFEDDAAEASGY